MDTIGQSLTSVAEDRPSNDVEDESSILRRVLSHFSTIIQFCEKNFLPHHQFFSNLQIISVRSETSVVAQVSKQIEDLSKSTEPPEGLDKGELANQVRLGEITPFQASAKIVQNQNDKR